MAQKWLKVETEYFVKLLQDYPILYDCNKNDQATMSLKREALEEMKLKMCEVKPEVTRDMIRQKVKTLRCQMNKEKKNAEIYKEKYTPKLWCYNQLLYLHNAIASNEEEPQEKDNDESADNCSNEPFVVYEIDSPPPSTVYSVEQSNSDNSKLQKRSWQEAFKDEESTGEVKSFYQPQQQQLRVRNFHNHSRAVIFCDYICSELEELDETLDEVKLEIVQIIMQAKAKERNMKQSKNLV